MGYMSYKFDDESISLLTSSIASKIKEGYISKDEYNARIEDLQNQLNALKKSENNPAQ